MQKILRTLIIIAMLITGYLLILAWRDDYTNVNKPVAKPQQPQRSVAMMCQWRGLQVRQRAMFPPQWQPRQPQLLLPSKRAHSSLA